MNAPATVIIENTGFSVEYWGRFSEAEFVEHGLQQLFFVQYAEDVRRSLLMMAYIVINDIA